MRHPLFGIAILSSTCEAPKSAPLNLSVVSIGFPPAVTLLSSCSAILHTGAAHLRALLLIPNWDRGRVVAGREDTM